MSSPRLKRTLSNDENQQGLCTPNGIFFGAEGPMCQLLSQGSLQGPRGARQQGCSGRAGSWHPCRQQPGGSSLALNGALCLRWGGNNLPFQCYPTSSVLATQSCLAEYFVAFLIYTYQILAVI